MQHKDKLVGGGAIAVGLGLSAGISLNNIRHGLIQEHVSQNSDLYNAVLGLEGISAVVGVAGLLTFLIGLFGPRSGESAA